MLPSESDDSFSCLSLLKFVGCEFSATSTSPASTLGDKESESSRGATSDSGMSQQQAEAVCKQRKKVLRVDLALTDRPADRLTD